MSNIVYLNGNFIPIGTAQISVMDRGFLFGDGVYENIPVYHNQFFQVHEHLQRLQKSLKRHPTALHHSCDRLVKYFREVIAT